jgi:hypothetical protein
VSDAGIRRHIQQIRQELTGRGVPAAQIAAVIAAQAGTTPIAAFRHAAGLTQAQAADRYNQRWPADPPKTFKQFSYWERWPGPHAAGSSASARAPSYPDLLRLAELYGCLADDLLRGPGRHPAAPAAPWPQPGDHGYPENPGDEPVISVCLPSGEGTVIVELSRRQFTGLLSASGIAALIPGAAPARSAASYRQILALHQAGHHLLAPAEHITELTRQLRSAGRNRASASRPDLLAVQSEYAEHISWLFRETGNLAACQHWARQATERARESGDPAMTAYMLLRNASLALDQRDHRQAARLAAAAQHTGPGLPPQLDGMARTYQARALALTGTLASRQLDQAAELIAAGQDKPCPAYLRFITPGFAGIQRATCYTDAGTPQPAITILQAAITALPAEWHRDRAVHLARLGAAHAAASEPDAAALAGTGALTEASRAGSRHAIAELRLLDTVLTSRWPSQPHVRQFHGALLAA